MTRMHGLFLDRSTLRWIRILRRLSRRLPKQTGSVITGRAYVTDGDGIKVAGREVRIAGVDAPEWNQPAKSRSGEWFNHGKLVKSAMIREVGGKQVRVLAEGRDKYGRVIGTVTCDGKDIGAWLVRNGHAIAAYSEKYRQVEREARSARRGMWGYAKFYDPRAWRHRDNQT